ncbi:MAG: calcium/sodium antiporter [Tenericutes bacterium]|nr:calcium/sodium antiporter [Mycoplasmatota bacterium]
MEIIKPLVILIAGFIILIKSSDIFVDAISSIATNFKMSKMMIALTVAAFGTCAPELAISFSSVAGGNGDIALANVVGSNVVNILFIVGVAACVSPIRVKSSVIKKELPILLVVTSVFVLSIVFHYFDSLSVGNLLNRVDGVLFFLFFLVFMVYIVLVVKTKQGFFERSKPKYNMTQSIIITIVCCICIVVASEIVVDNAILLAQKIDVSTKLITMTIIAIGTSLPEMTMTVIAAKRGEFDIALGNIIGTNIFNIGIVLGLPLIIYGGFGSLNFNIIDMLAVHIAAFTLYMFAKNDKVLSRLEGSIMICMFLIYYTYIFLT